MDQRESIRLFYEEIWNAHDTTKIPMLLAEGFTFRGSLGEEKNGRTGFAEYVHAVHEALADYPCQTHQVLVDRDSAFAKMTFSGVHTGTLLGFPPTGRKVSWAGAALFKFQAGLISDLWVLGDLLALERQLRND
jgi:steroid delta-isomerase-like uncharacterized protein